VHKKAGSGGNAVARDRQAGVVAAAAAFVQRAGLPNPKPYIPDSPCSEKRALRAGLAAWLSVADATSAASRWPHSPSRTPSLRGTDCRTD